MMKLSEICCCGSGKTPQKTAQSLGKHITTRSHLSITRGWVNSSLGRHWDGSYLVKSISQETKRLEVPRCFLEETIRYLHEYIQDRPTEIVFNIDEVGIVDWEDQKSKKVILPSSMRGQKRDITE
jgi:hypothetical protein